MDSHFYCHRTTPHSTTNVAPCELFLGRKVRTRIDLLKPEIGDQVMQKQAQQKAQHDYHAKYREFQIGQKVMVRSMQPGFQEKSFRNLGL